MRYNQRPVSIRAQLLAAVAESGLSDRQLSVLATGSTDTIRNLRRGAAPRADTLEALCRVLGLSLRLAPGEDESRTRAQGAPSQSDDENALAPRPLSRFSDTVTLPVRHLADDSPDCEVRREESKRAAAPEDLTDEQAFYVRIAGKSMLPSDIWPNDYCLVSPCERFEAGKAVWLRHRTGAETIKWLLRLPADAYDLGAWKPPDELGHQKPFKESWSRADVADRGVVLTAYTKRPSTDEPATWRKFRPDPLAELWRSTVFGSNEDLKAAVDQLDDTGSAVEATLMRLSVLVAKGKFSESEIMLLLETVERREERLRRFRSSVKTAVAQAGEDSAAVTPATRD